MTFTLLSKLWHSFKRDGRITDDAVEAIAREAGVPSLDVTATASFYPMFSAQGGAKFSLINTFTTPKWQGAVCKTPILSRRFDNGGVQDIRRAVEMGAYNGSKKALGMKSQEVIEEIKGSNLRGRGGAGFPTGEKLASVKAARGKPVYLVINADEGEPCAFKDMTLLSLDPHLVIEGAMIAVHAVQAQKAFIYFRGDCERELEVFESAVAEVNSAGFRLDIEAMRNAGAYVCGEETALISSIEGRRGYPREKPPYPTEKGLDGAPTVILNCETLANLPFIMNEGAEKFKGIGTAESSGTKLVSICGGVERDGVFEVEMGMPFAKFLAECAMGTKEGRVLRAVFPGGISTPVLIANEALGAKISFESFETLGSSLGTGGIIVLDESHDIRAMLSDIAKFFAMESCGQCAPCREGSGWLSKITDRINSGAWDERDVDLLRGLPDGIEGRVMCPLGSSLARSVRVLVEKFEVEM